MRHAERENKIIEFAVRMRPQLTVKRVKGDGNCFPRSISEHMNLDHEDVRMFFVNEVKNNPEEYKEFIDDVIAWSEDMKNSGTWVDGIAPKATANCLNRPIVVFRKLNPFQRPTAFLPPPFDDGDDLVPLCVELDETPGAEHYNPLVKGACVANVAGPLRKRFRFKQSETPSPSFEDVMATRSLLSMIGKKDGDVMDTEPSFDGDKGELSLDGVGGEGISASLPMIDDVVPELSLDGVGGEGISASLPMIDDVVPGYGVADAVENDPKSMRAPDTVLESADTAPMSRCEEMTPTVEAEASIPVVAEGFGFHVGVKAEASIPARRLLKRLRRMTPVVEVEASTHVEAEASIPEEDEASIPKEAEASIPKEAEASIPVRRRKKRRSKKTPIAANENPVKDGAKPETSAPLEKAATDDGLFMKGTIMGIEEEGRCRRCSSMVTRSRAKISGKKKGYWLCLTCNSKSVQLHSIFGKWPPTHFKTLSEDKQQEFFAGIKEIKEKAKLKLYTENYLRTTHEDNKGTKDKTKFLPLSVWKSRGFNVRRIKKRCKKTQQHPVLGKLYGVEITETYNGQEEKQVRGEDTIVTDRPEPPASTVGLAKLSATQDREQKKTAMETIRVEKALATQEARDAKYNMNLCQKFLRRTTRLNFNLSNAAVQPKIVKKMPEATQKRLAATRTKLMQTQKALAASILDGGKTKINEKECERACRDGELLIECFQKHQVLTSSMV